MPVNLFDIPKVVNLVLPETTGATGIRMNYPINKTDFSVVKGISQSIQFFVRDIDRQFVVLSGQTLTINIISRANTLLLSRDLIVVDVTQSLFAFVMAPSDTLDWTIGPLSYSIMVTRPDGSQTLLWTDLNYGPHSYLTVQHGPVPAPAAPQTLVPSTFIINNSWAYSGPLAVQAGYPGGVQTFAVYSTDFVGTLQIQGSLQQQPTSPTDWFVILQQDFETVSGVTAISVYGGVYLWLQILLPVNEPEQYQITPPITSGSVDQILYKK